MEKKAENLSTTEIDSASVSFARKNRLALVGFSLMIAGPLTLLIAGLVQQQIGYFIDFAAIITIWTAILLPIIGAGISVISLVMWKKIGIVGRVVSIVTVLIVCNPIVFVTYYAFCAFGGSRLAAPPLL